MQKKFIILFILIFYTFLLCSCSNRESSEQIKDTLTICTVGEPYRFFPQSKNGCGGDDNIVLCNIYDCLLKLENDGTLSPAIATSYEISDDALSYTFHLRDDVTFHNGYPLTAEDVKFTFDLGSKGPLGSALFINYESCDIIDDYTVRINLSAPYSAFLYGASSRLGCIISKAYYDEVGEEGYKAKPIGTGPYKFVEYASGDHTLLEANEHYWNNKPDIQKVIIKIVADSNTQMLGLRNGDYDIVRNPQISTCVRYCDDGKCCYDVTDSTGPIVLYLGEWLGPCKDTNFRKAIQYAINKQDINTFVYEGKSITLDVSLCKMYGGYVDSNDGIFTPEYDKNIAMDYLKHSNYNHEPFYITVPSESILEKCGKVIQSELMDIGINCRLNTVDTITYSEIQNSRNYDAIIINNISSLIDADSLSTLHRLDRWDASRIYSRDSEINALLMNGRITSGSDRLPYYIEACNIINKDAYEVPLVNDIVTIAYSDKLNGVRAHCLNYCYANEISFKTNEASSEHDAYNP